MRRVLGRLTAGLAAATLVLVLSGVPEVVKAVHKAYYGPTICWTAADVSSSYAPKNGCAYVYHYHESFVYVRPRTYGIVFDQAAIDAIRAYHTNNNYRYTQDTAVPNDWDTTLSANGWYSTDFPDPHFDRDDDPPPFGNGYYDETEVTVLDTFSLAAGTPYLFVSEFVDYTNGRTSDVLKLTAQISVLQGSEWNTVNYDYLKSVAYDTYPMWSFLGSATAATHDTVTSKGGRLPDLGLLRPSERLKTSQGLEQFASALRKWNAEALAKGVDPVRAVVTFRRPVTADEFAALVEKYRLGVQWFHVRALTAAGRRVTLQGRPEDGSLVPMARIQSLLAHHSADFAGVVGAYVAAPRDFFSLIEGEPMVFAVDASPEALELRTVLPPVYWYLEEAGLVTR